MQTHANPIVCYFPIDNKTNMVKYPSSRNHFNLYHKVLDLGSVTFSSICLFANKAILFWKTRMHSSRMRTVRSSSRLLAGVCRSACWDTPPPPLAWTPPGPGPGHPPCGQTDTCENITFANFVCGR